MKRAYDWRSLEIMVHGKVIKKRGEDMGDIKNVWNPRFLKYCESIGKKPEEVNSDTMQGWTVGFDEWLKQKMGEFAQVKLEAFYHGIYGTTLTDHKAFDEWLTATPQEGKR